ncbi:ribosomal protein S5 domain 2-like protein [Meredithblackwellia eburnea MCA 4105]
MQNSRAQLLTASNLRLDSRLPLELRALSFQILPAPPTSFGAPAFPPAQADGYALVSHGLTRVSASVFGPREAMRTGAFSGGVGGGAGGGGGGKGMDKATVNVEVGVAAWSERNTAAPGVRKGGKDRRTVELSASIKATFEPVLLLHLYPRSSIDVYIQVLEVDGALLQASINATSLALISAGLPLSDYVCALSLASYPSISPEAPPQKPPFELVSPGVAHSNDEETGNIGSGSTTILDLCQNEEQGLPNLTVAVLPRSEKVTLVNLESRVGIVRFEEMLRWGVEGAKVVQGAMEECVKSWAQSLAAPSKNLGALFPGMAGAKGNGDDDMEE